MRTSRATGKTARFFLNMLVIFAFAATAMVMQPARYATAQEERRSILQFLFGNRVRQPQRFYDDVPMYEPRQPRRQQEQRPKVRKTKQKAAAPVIEEKPVVAEKLPDAKKVLVIGDFIAGSLGDGLATAFETTPGIVIDTQADGSSGLVREDYFDWPDLLPVYIDTVKPSLIIISLGANDRQQMKIGTDKEKFKTDLWLGEYARRAAAIAALARKDKLPLLWVGMPPFQSAAMTADMVTLNGIFRTEAEKAGGQFIDIWDGFVDENGKFVLTGSDINGQQVRLRGSDGINLTAAGKRKLAFYLEKDIRHLLGDAAASGTDVPGTDGLKDLMVTAPAANEDIIRTKPIALDDPDLDGGATLMGAATLPAATGRSARDLLVEKGEVASPPAGRVDDFRLAKPESVISNPVIRN